LWNLGKGNRIVGIGKRGAWGNEMGGRTEIGRVEPSMGLRLEEVFQEMLEGIVNELSGIDLSDNSRCSLSCEGDLSC